MEDDVLRQKEVVSVTFDTTFFRLTVAVSGSKMGCITYQYTLYCAVI